jgi:hypothetical protein
MSHSSSLQELNALLLEDPHPVNDRFNAEALAPFTDTLFYDWDSGRMLEGEPDDHNAESPLETGHENPDLVDGAVNALNGMYVCKAPSPLEPFPLIKGKYSTLSSLQLCPCMPLHIFLHSSIWLPSGSM